MKFEEKIEIETKKQGFFSRIKKRILPYALLSAGFLSGLLGCSGGSDIFSGASPSTYKGTVAPIIDKKEEKKEPEKPREVEKKPSFEESRNKGLQEPKKVEKPIPKPKKTEFIDEFVFSAGQFPKRNIYLKEGNRITQLTNESRDDSGPAISSDGKTIFYSSLDLKTKTGGIYKINRDKSGKREIISDVSEFAISPDGQLIAFLGTTGKFSDVFISKIDGTGKRNISKTKTANEIGPLEWSPDGKQIICSSFNHGNFDINIINKDGSGTTNITNSPEDEFNPVLGLEGQVIFQQGLFGRIFIERKKTKDGRMQFGTIPAWKYNLIASKVEKKIDEKRFKEVYESFEKELAGPFIVSPDGKQVIAILNKGYASGVDAGVGLFEIGLDISKTNYGKKKFLKQLFPMNSDSVEARFRQYKSKIETLKKTKNIKLLSGKICIAGINDSEKKTLEGIVIEKRENLEKIEWSPKGNKFILHYTQVRDKTRNENVYYFINSNNLHNKLLEHLTEFKWSFDGKYLAVATKQYNKPGNITVYNSNDLSVVASTEIDSQPRRIMWDTENKKLFYYHSKYEKSISKDKRAIFSWNITDMVPKKIKEIKERKNGILPFVGTISPEGNYVTHTESRVIYQEGVRNEFLNFLDGSKPIPLNWLSGKLFWIWTPDGRKFATGDWMYNLDTNTKTKLTDSNRPSWMPHKKIEEYKIRGKNAFIVDGYKSPAGDLIAGLDGNIGKTEKINNLILMMTKAILMSRSMMHGGSKPVWRR